MLTSPEPNSRRSNKLPEVSVYAGGGPSPSKDPRAICIGLHSKSACQTPFLPFSLANSSLSESTQGSGNEGRQALLSIIWNVSWHDLLEDSRATQIKMINACPFTSYPTIQTHAPETFAQGQIYMFQEGF